MTYFEDFYATSAEVPHPTLTSSAILHPSTPPPPPLRIPQSFELPKRTRQPTYLPTALSKQENHSETFTNQNINIWCETKKKQQAKFPPLPIDSHNVKIQKQFTDLVH